MDNTLDDVVEALKVHENRSQNRYERLMGIVSGKTDEKEDSMSAREDLNIIGGGNDGFGGGGMLGGLLIGALLGRGGRGGLFGGEGGEGGAAAVGLQSSIDTNTIMQSLGDIKAAVPLAEAQVQLALAGAQADITSQTLQQTIALQNQGFQSQLANVQGFATTKDAVDSLSTQVAVGLGNVSREIATTGWAVTTAISNDGEKTRAMLTAQNDATLNRIIVTQAAELAELRNEGNRDRDRHGIEINMINNQNQNQLQFQQQAQVMAQLANVLADVSQVARATNSTVMVGNTGTTAANQTANPTNVRA